MKKEDEALLNGEHPGGKINPTGVKRIRIRKPSSRKRERTLGDTIAEEAFKSPAMSKDKTACFQGGRVIPHGSGAEMTR